MNCKACGKDFKRAHITGHVVSISGSIMGDECIESYYFCDDCRLYTLEVYFDYFSGEEVSNVYGPISRQEGDAKVALIRQCGQPWNKKCRCPAHRAYFNDLLD